MYIKLFPIWSKETNQNDKIANKKPRKNVKKKKKKIGNRNWQRCLCRRRRGVGDGGIGLRGQSPAEVCVLAASRRVSVGCGRICLGLSRICEPGRLLHHSHTVDQAQVPGRAVRGYRLPAHGDQAAQSEPTRKWNRRRLSGDQSRWCEWQDELLRVTGRCAGRHLVLPAIA